MVASVQFSARLATSVVDSCEVDGRRRRARVSRGGSAGSDHSNDCSINVSLGLCSNDSIVAWMRWTAAIDGLVVRRRSVDQSVAVAGGDRRQPAAQLVGAVPAELALVARLDGGAAAAATAEALLALLELGDLPGLPGRQRRRRRLDARQQVAGRGDDRRSGAVECARQLGEGPAPFGELRIGGEQSGPGEVAAPAATAACAAWSGSVPSATSRAVSAGAAIGPNSTRTHRDAIVTRSTGTKSARTMKWVDAGGSSIVFNRRPAPTALSRWNSWRISTLRSPSTGDRAAWRTISAACSAEIAGPTRTTSRTSGCSPASANLASRVPDSSLPVSNRAANARAASSFVEPGGPTNR